MAAAGRGQVPRALAGAVAWQPQAAPRCPWWRLITAWQWLLTVLAVGGVVWAVVIAVARAAGKSQRCSATYR